LAFIGKQIKFLWLGEFGGIKETFQFDNKLGNPHFRYEKNIGIFIFKIPKKYFLVE
jgi:hypothetical protein